MTKLMLALVVLLGLSHISQAGLLASAYKAVPCADYAPGCFVEPTSLPDDLTWDPFAWTSFWQATFGSTYVGYMTPRDANIDGWIVGHIWLLYWDEDLLGPWDGELHSQYIAGETQFVYRADVGAICCMTDWPFNIFAINDDGYIFTNGAYDTGLYHTSTIDSFPSHDAALWPNVIWPGDLYSLLFQPAYFGIDAQGAISVGEGDISGDGPMFALVPVPEPSTNLLSALSLLLFAVTRRRLSSGPKPHR